MSYFVGLLNGLDQRRREEREQATKDANAEQDREVGLLMQLAQGDDPEIASMAGAGLLEILSGNKKVTGAKGLRGFLGEVDRSSYLPQIRATLQARGAQPPTPGVPGGAALPGASPVEPKAQGAKAGQPPMLEMPLVSRQGLGLVPSAPPGGPGSDGLGLLPGGAPSGFTQDGGGAAVGPASGPMGAAALPPPPPEAPQQRYARLFPSASEVAQRTKVAELMARFQVAMQALDKADTPDKRNLVMAMNGAPQAQLRPTAYNVTFINELGMEDHGVGVMDADGTVNIDGRQVRPITVEPVNQRSRAPQHFQRLNKQTNLMERVTYDPDTMETLRVDPLNIPANLPPQLEGGQVPLAGGGIGVVPRGAPPGTVVPIPGARQRPTSTRTPDPKKSERARAAAAFLADVKAEITNTAKTKKDLVTGAMPDIPVSTKDAITKRKTAGQFVTYQELLLASQGLGAPPPDAPAAPTGALGSPEGAGQIDELLRRRRR
jgi:hypothetical protein